MNCSTSSSGAKLTAPSTYIQKILTVKKTIIKLREHAPEGFIWPFWNADMIFNLRYVLFLALQIQRDYANCVTALEKQSFFYFCR